MLKKGEDFITITERDYESDGLIDNIGVTNDFEKALIIAMDYKRENEVEYGIEYRSG